MSKIPTQRTSGPDDYSFSDDTPLGEVRAWVEERSHNGGARCPACNQRAQVYKRSINHGMARSIAVMYSVVGTNWAYIPDIVGARSREEGKLRYWGLLEEESTRRPDGGRRGWWRVTPNGVLFVRGALMVQKHALIYDGELLGLEGPLVSIQDCIAERFDLAELLSR